MTGKIFISYRRSDSVVVAHRMFDWLVEQFGAEAVFIDIDRIPYGADFRAHITDQVRQARIVLLIIGETWLEALHNRTTDPDDWLRHEIETAFAEGKDIVPVLIDRTTMPAAKQLPPSFANLAFLNAATVSATKDFRHHMGELGERLAAEWGFEKRAKIGKGRAPAALARLVGSAQYNGPRAPMPRVGEPWQVVRLPRPVNFDETTASIRRRFLEAFVQNDLLGAVWVDNSGETTLALLTKHSTTVYDFARNTAETRSFNLGNYSSRRGVKLAPYRGGVLINTGLDVLNWRVRHRLPSRVCSVSEYHDDVSSVLCASPDLRYIALSSQPYGDTDLIQLVDFESGETVFSHRGGSLVKRFDFSRSCRHLLASPRAIADQSALLISASSEAKSTSNVKYEASHILGTNEHPWLGPAAWHPTEDVFVITQSERTQRTGHVKIIRAADLSVLHSRRLEHTDHITDVDWSSDGRFVATASEDYSVVVWDLATDTTKLLTGHDEKIEYMKFSPDGQRLVTHGRARNFHLWNPVTGDKLTTIEGIVGRNTWGSDARLILSRGANGHEVRKMGDQ